MQNLVLLMEPSADAADIDLKGGNMCLNRFSIDEEAAFEISGVHYLKKATSDDNMFDDDVDDDPKGKGYYHNL